LSLVVVVGVLPAQPASAPSRTLPLLETLVNNSLKVADEPDPLRRARYCTDVADQLSRLLAQPAARKDQALAKRLAGYLDRVWQQGVADNVARIQVDNIEEKQFNKVKNEVKSLKERANRINHNLETQLKNDEGPAMLPLPPGIKLPGRLENDIDKTDAAGKNHDKK